MTISERLQLRTNEKDIYLLEDIVESAKAAILARRYPFGEYPAEFPRRYEDLVYRISLAMYNKIGGEYETDHTENGVTRKWGSAGIPEDLLNEVTPLVGGPR